MAEGYCVKCKAKKEVVDAVEAVMKNGRKAIKGKCPDCATVMFKILGGKAESNSGSTPSPGAGSAGPAASRPIIAASKLPSITPAPEEEPDSETGTG